MSAEYITYGGHTYAIVVRNNFNEPGTVFFTPPDLSQQLAHMSHPKGKKITPHIHNAMAPEINHRRVVETLIIKKGSVEVDLYTPEKKYAKSFVLFQGDVVMLLYGGHGFTALEPLEMWEVRQGPYNATDKTRFEIKA